MIVFKKKMKKLTFLGICYHFLETPLAWDDAKEECKSMSGYGGDGDLASLNSFLEQSFVQRKYFLKSLSQYKQLIFTLHVHKISL